ncbi:unnamed protein product [Chrysoparadoxa australica]
MGQCMSMMPKSGPEKAEKSKDDRFLQKIKLPKCKIKEFDAAFKGAEDPMCDMVDTNNNLCEAVENVKIIAAISMGCYTPVPGADHVIKLHKDDKELTAAAQTEALAKNVPLNVALTAANAAAHELNVIKVEGFALVEGRNGRVVAKLDKDKIKDETAVANARTCVLNYNTLLFSLRKVAAEASMKDGMNLAEALKHIFKQLKIADPKAKPKVDVNKKALEGFIAGEEGADPTTIVKLKMKPEKTLPKEHQKMYNAVMGKKGLMEALDETITDMGTFPEKLEKAAGLVSDLPTDLEGFKAAIDGSGLMKKPKNLLTAFKTVGKNVMTVKTAPTIAKHTGETLQWTIDQLKEGVEKSNDLKEGENAKDLDVHVEGAIPDPEKVVAEATAAAEGAKAEVTAAAEGAKVEVTAAAEGAKVEVTAAAEGVKADANAAATTVAPAQPQAQLAGA